MNITSFLIYCFIVTVTPGPTNIVILSTVHNWGTKKAIEYTYGATIAVGLLLIISAMMNTMLITVIPKILIYMQIIGTLYMLYLAYQIYKANTSEPTIKETATFMSGLFMQFLNPKVVLFTMTVIPSFILPYYTSMPTVAISIVTIALIGFSSLMIWVLFGSIFKRFLQSHEKIVNVVMALFLVYAAAMIWI